MPKDRRELMHDALLVLTGAAATAVVTIPATLYVNDRIKEKQGIRVTIIESNQGGFSGNTDEYRYTFKIENIGEGQIEEISNQIFLEANPGFDVLSQNVVASPRNLELMALATPVLDPIDPPEMSHQYLFVIQQLNRGDYVEYIFTTNVRVALAAMSGQAGRLSHDTVLTRREDEDPAVTQMEYKED